MQRETNLRAGWRHRRWEVCELVGVCVCECVCSLCHHGDFRCYLLSLQT